MGDAVYPHRHCTARSVIAMGPLMWPRSLFYAILQTFPELYVSRFAGTEIENMSEAETELGFREHIWTFPMKGMSTGER